MYVHTFHTTITKIAADNYNDTTMKIISEHTLGLLTNNKKNSNKNNVKLSDGGQQIQYIMLYIYFLLCCTRISVYIVLLYHNLRQY